MEACVLPDRRLYDGQGWYFKARESYFCQLLEGLQGRVLDVGCGSGMVGRILQKHEVWGIDTDPQALVKAGKHMLVKQCSADDLLFPPEYFDAVTCFDVLEHLKDEEAALHEFRRVLKPQGKLFITVPLEQKLWSEHDKACGHFRRYELPELIKKLNENGFTVLKTRKFMALPRILAPYIKNRSNLLKNIPLVDLLLLYWFKIEELARNIIPLPGLTGVIVARKGCF